MERKNRFGEFIANLRKEKGISLEQLSDGLCDLSTISRFERGEREPEKLLQNRFLTRLGVVPENYENFLYYKDYCRWEKRQGILHYILEEDMMEAKRLLEEYRQEYDMNYSLEQQFYLAMLAQIRRYEGCSKEELADIFEKALLLTVPNIDSRSFRNRILSLEELNLLLEYRFCRNQGVSLQFYEVLIDYIEKMERTPLAMAKIYPKAVHYYHETWKLSGERKEERAERMLELCDKAIELLRNANRMFYLWELFCMKEELTSVLPEKMQTGEGFLKSLEECRDWRETLEELYREYNISIAMYEFCYLYVESENYCYGDVVRIRREMLGMSRVKLRDGICDERTLRNLEKNRSKTQREIVEQLFERLNLSTELCRTELVTENQEVIEKYEEMGRQINNRNFTQVKLLIDELKEIVSLNIPSNQQAIMRNEVLNSYNQGHLSKHEYITNMKRALEYTVPYEVAVGTGEKYFTKEEIVCLQNLTLKTGWTFQEMEECVTALVRMCENPKYPANYVRMYEYIMVTVSSYLGDKGEYTYSNQIKRNILDMSLKSRRMKAIDNALYGIIWNNEQMIKLGLNIEINVIQHELLKCIQMSRLSNKSFREKIYKEKYRKNLESAKNKRISPILS